MLWHQKSENTILWNFLLQDPLKSYIYLSQFMNPWQPMLSWFLPISSMIFQYFLSLQGHTIAHAHNISTYCKCKSVIVGNKKVLISPLTLRIMYLSGWFMDRSFNCTSRCSSLDLENNRYRRGITMQTTAAIRTMRPRLNWMRRILEERTTMPLYLRLKSIQK